MRLSAADFSDDILNRSGSSEYCLLSCVKIEFMKAVIQIAADLLSDIRPCPPREARPSRPYFLVRSTL